MGEINYGKKNQHNVFIMERSLRKIASYNCDERKNIWKR